MRSHGFTPIRKKKKATLTAAWAGVRSRACMYDVALEGGIITSFGEKLV
jgi:hypothetical protein